MTVILFVSGYLRKALSLFALTGKITKKRDIMMAVNCGVTNAALKSSGRSLGLEIHAGLL